MTKRYVGYLRVSTARQGRSGLGLEAQRASVLGFIHGQGGALLAEFTEVESGKSADRAQLEAALGACRIHGAVLVIAKLDRLARNVEFIARLMNAGVEFVCVDAPHANRLTIHILAAMAEHEREMISARTKAALAQAKARGVKLGGNRGTIGQVAREGGRASGQVRQCRAAQRAQDLRPLFEKLEHQGTLSLRSVARALNVPAPNGGAWSQAQVGRVKRTWGA
jgi:DNA invertase Pin-like site-specific DNA recombinase